MGDWGAVQPMKYLYTEKADGNFGIKKLQFTTHLQGRTWLGIAEAGDELAATAMEKFPLHIREITKEEYDELKKNVSSYSDFSTIIQDPTLPVHAQPAEAEPVEADSLLMLGEATGG